MALSVLGSSSERSPQLCRPLDDITAFLATQWGSNTSHAPFRCHLGPTSRRICLMRPMHELMAPHEAAKPTQPATQRVGSLPSHTRPAPARGLGHRGPTGGVDSACSEYILP